MRTLGKLHSIAVVATLRQWLRGWWHALACKGATATLALLVVRRSAQEGRLVEVHVVHRTATQTRMDRYAAGLRYQGHPHRSLYGKVRMGGFAQEGVLDAFGCCWHYRCCCCCCGRLGGLRCWLIYRQYQVCQVAPRFDQNQGALVDGDRCWTLARNMHRRGLSSNRSLYRSDFFWVGVHPLQTAGLCQGVQRGDRQGVGLLWGCCGLWRRRFLGRCCWSGCLSNGDRRWHHHIHWCRGWRCGLGCGVVSYCIQRGCLGCRGSCSGCYRHARRRHRCCRCW